MHSNHDAISQNCGCGDLNSCLQCRRGSRGLGSALSRAGPNGSPKPPKIEDQSSRSPTTDNRQNESGMRDSSGTLEEGGDSRLVSSQSLGKTTDDTYLIENDKRLLVSRACNSRKRVGSPPMPPKINP